MKHTQLPARTKPIARGSAPNKKRKGDRRGPLRDPGYLDWLKERRCIVCWRGFPAEYEYYMLWCDPAHGPVNGTRSKGPDDGAIPLCRFHHAEQHKIGWPEFERKYGFSRSVEAARLYAEYAKTKT